MCILVLIKIPKVRVRLGEAQCPVVGSIRLDFIV